MSTKYTRSQSCVLSYQIAFFCSNVLRLKGFSVAVPRVFLALSQDVKDRGTIVAHGGGKVSHRAGIVNL